ncbi:MAG: TolC family protein [bacterium]
MINLITLIFSFAIISQPPTVLTLDEAMNIAFRGNLDIKIAEQNLLSAKADYRSAISNFLPTLSFSSSYTRYPDEKTQTYYNFNPVTGQFTTEEIVSRPKAMHSSGFNLSWVLFTGGARWANVNINSATVRMQEYQTSITQENIAYGTFSAYLGLIQAEKAKLIAEEALQQANENYKLTETMYQIGSSTNLDLLRAEVQVSQQEGNLIQAENNLEAAKNSLCDILDIEKTELTAVEPVFKEINLLSLDSCQAIAINSPAVGMAQAGVDIAEAAKRTTISPFLPTVSLFGAYNWSGQNYEFDEPEYYGGVQFSWEIFSGTSRFHDYSSAGFQHTASVLELSDAKQEILSTTEKDYLSVQSAIAFWETAVKTMQSAQQSYNLTLRMYENGMVTSLDLFEAQNTLEEARLAELSAYYSKYTALAKLLSDMGILKTTIINGGIYE